MTETIRVDADHLRSVSADLARAHEAVTGEIDVLRHRLAPLQHDWTGDASQAYHYAMSAYATHLLEMTSVLARLNHAVWSSRETFTTTDAEVAAAWQ
ncbi:WXG100 family type VII secretion target [Cellulomonas bogoriensis]|uniref:ESAT-6-like protein n=1 Tax=Cellulomonas bogoriensis 69B4 = DSM 16987 TaxID=1386082 RepID=A0A0A0C3H5_9CELL|nr:WXG100 family type VII secretion target [Cellulomonas bogoriensis]KGM14592.1 hypothetical protein N869_05170 [Cellulomonas bogoriensis 69B4 = DSM 16987]